MDDDRTHGSGSTPQEDSADLLPVMALHALAYCPRLFYLENVEGQRVANAKVYAGRELHSALERKHGDSIQVDSRRLGLRGRVDFIRSEQEGLIPVEVKRGRAKRTDTGLTGWPSDLLQVTAYAMLLEDSPADDPCSRLASTTHAMVPGLGSPLRITSGRMCGRPSTTLGGSAHRHDARLSPRTRTSVSIAVSTGSACQTRNGRSRIGSCLPRRMMIVRLCMSPTQVRGSGNQRCV